MVGRGAVLVTGNDMNLPLSSGLRLGLTADQDVTVVNTGLEEAEVVLMTLHAHAAWQADAPPMAEGQEAAALRPVAAIGA
jgi:hypothetical protein